MMLLFDSVKYIKGVGPKKAEALGKLGINTVYDLLTYYPRTYEDQSVVTPIAELRPGEHVAVLGTIMNLQEKQGGRRGLSILTAMTALAFSPSPGSTRNSSRISSSPAKGYL